jgi:uncharacterized membrane protein
MVYILAVASALANALTSILQRMGVEDAPESSSMHLSLLTHALKRGVWLLGFRGHVVTFLMQAVALHLGDLSQVQPILTTELLFLVLLLATWFRFRIGRVGVDRVSGRGRRPGRLSGCSPNRRRQPGTYQSRMDRGGLDLRGRRAAGHQRCPARTPLVAGGHVRHRRRRRVRLHRGAHQDGGNYYAAGWTTHVLPLADLRLAICGVGSLFLAQNAFHAGPIAASQTALVLVDPLASMAIGIGLFGDNLRTAGAFGPLEALSLLVMFGGAASIAHSPLISGMKGDDERYSEMLSLRSRSKRLVEAVQEQVPTEVIEQLPPDRARAPSPRGDSSGCPPTDPGISDRL